MTRRDAAASVFPHEDLLPGSRVCDLVRGSVLKTRPAASTTRLGVHHLTAGGALAEYELRLAL